MGTGWSRMVYGPYLCRGYLQLIYYVSTVSSLSMFEIRWPFLVFGFLPVLRSLIVDLYPRDLKTGKSVLRLEYLGITRQFSFVLTGVSSVYFSSTRDPQVTPFVMLIPRRTSRSRLRSQSGLDRRPRTAHHPLLTRWPRREDPKVNYAVWVEHKSTGTIPQIRKVGRGATGRLTFDRKPRLTR